MATVAIKLLEDIELSERWESVNQRECEIVNYLDSLIYCPEDVYVPKDRSRRERRRATRRSNARKAYALRHNGVFAPEVADGKHHGKVRKSLADAHGERMYLRGNRRPEYVAGDFDNHDAAVCRFYGFVNQWLKSQEV